ncbi:MAG: RagB/SusD family nutrient uptake outer membrane protein [Prevotellaceae bacterium]|nr:RagB/SusD family nutrient uptake outer membrane protein [Prevotellaceae bacterium]
MKKYILSAAVLLSATMFTSCDDMLDSEPRKTEATPETFTDINALNAGTYSIMNVLAGRDATSFPLYMWEIMSDNCYGSGGLQDDEVKSLHHLVEKNVNQYETPFITLYGGVSRANTQIATINNLTWADSKKAQRDQLLGEAYFMRGLYNLWLTQMYGDIALITSTVLTTEMQEEVSAEEFVYPQILSDFVSAKNLMGTKKNSGHADKFVAEAFIARAYMFWAGFYKNAGELANGSAPAIKLVEQEGCTEGSLTQAAVVEGLKDVVANGGYKLCEDYRSLWQYSNSLLWAEANDGVGHAYKFIADMKEANCFDKPGMGNGNTEELFQIQFMNASKWAIGDTYYTNSRQYSNYVSCFWGLRCNGTNGTRATTYPFNQGWGQGTPSRNIWDDWTEYEKTNAEATIASTGAKGDIRKLGSLIDCENELEAYTFEKDDCEESGYSVKKFNSVCLDACANDLDTWWTKAPGYVKSSLENSMQGDHFEDFYLMRYADVLLMLTELTGDAQYMNQVQARAGVKQTPYSLKAVQDERRWEFAFEGLRFNDMRRWTGNKPTADSYAPKALQAQEGKLITVKGVKNAQTMKHMTCSWTERYIATNGFLSKPQNQIALMNGQLRQNAGWDASDSKTQYMQLYQ